MASNNEWPLKYEMEIWDDNDVLSKYQNDYDVSYAPLELSSPNNFAILVRYLHIHEPTHLSLLHHDHRIVVENNGELHYMSRDIFEDYKFVKFIMAKSLFQGLPKSMHESMLLRFMEFPRSRSLALVHSGMIEMVMEIGVVTKTKNSFNNI